MRFFIKGLKKIYDNLVVIPFILHMTTTLSNKKTEQAFTMHLEVSLQIVSAFHRLRELAILIHGEDFSAGLRGVLRSLQEKARTVPELARMRPVSRQHMQQVVDILIDRKFARAVANPAHARSNLIEITPRGKKEYARMMRVEKAMVDESFGPQGIARLGELSKSLQWYLSEMDAMKEKVKGVRN